jgi:hypothetical protein
MSGECEICAEHTLECICKSHLNEEYIESCQHYNIEPHIIQSKKNMLESYSQCKDENKNTKENSLEIAKTAYKYVKQAIKDCEERAGHNILCYWDGYISVDGIIFCEYELKK